MIMMIMIMIMITWYGYDFDYDYCYDVVSSWSWLWVWLLCHFGWQVSPQVANLRDPRTRIAHEGLKVSPFHVTVKIPSIPIPILQLWRWIS